MSQDRPRITMVTVVRNNAATVARAIESVLSQNYPNLEYIVMDGASNDGTVEVIGRYRDQLSHFISRPDRNAVERCNEAIDMASGQWIAFLNGDDILLPGALEAVAAAILQNPQAELVCTGVEMRELATGTLMYRYNNPAELELTLENMLGGFTHFNAKWYKLSMLKKHGHFTEDFPGHKVFYSNDREYLIGLALAGVRSVAIAHVAYQYGAHAGSNTFGTTFLFHTLTEHQAIADRFLAKKLHPEHKQLLIAWKAQEKLVFYLRLLARRRVKEALGHLPWLVLHPILSFTQGVKLLHRKQRNQQQLRANKRV